MNADFSVRHLGSQIPYILKASAKRRTVGLRIDRRGLVVNIPRGLPHGTLEDILQRRAGWIAAKLQEFQARQPTPICWQDGEKLLLLGNEITLCLARAPHSGNVELAAGRLLLALPDIDNTELVARKVRQWYRSVALADFTRRVGLLAAKLGVPAPPVFLSGARTRWGSCNSSGEIRLGWRLIQAPPDIIHYVAAHELAHLKQMNHGPQFWAVVESLCPDCQAARRTLKGWSARLQRL